MLKLKIISEMKCSSCDVSLSEDISGSAAKTQKQVLLSSLGRFRLRFVARAASRARVFPGRFASGQI